MERLSVLVLATVMLVGLALAGKRPTSIPEDPRDVPREAQLTLTRTKTDLDGDGRPEGLVLVNALTGEHAPDRASEVIFGITAPESDGDRGDLLWVRHAMKQTGRPAHDGEMSALDLDGDGVSELILTWDRSLSAERVERWAEIYTLELVENPRKVWEGFWERDSRRDPQTPAAEREWMRREIDYAATRRAAGLGIVFLSTHGMIAGQPLDPPRLVPDRVDVALRDISAR
ncbi:MAG: hypothetical protein JSV80_13015 [Acidobacteriota bacterium]|nr:MAG: hypothetical protein JSV80_13015 [Acidobacteriota bacterium]